MTYHLYTKEFSLSFTVSTLGVISMGDINDVFSAILQHFAPNRFLRLKLTLGYNFCITFAHPARVAAEREDVKVEGFKSPLTQQ